MRCRIYNTHKCNYTKTYAIFYDMQNVSLIPFLFAFVKIFYVEKLKIDILLFYYTFTICCTTSDKYIADKEN